VTSERGRPDLEAPDLESPDLDVAKGPQETAAPEGDDPASTGPTAGEPTVDEEADAAEEAVEDDLAVTRQALAELTSDLQRLQAEFLNYKRRVERDRDLVRQNAVFTVLTPMLDVLDSIDRARDAGELDGGFKGVADQLERIVNGLGLTRFGEPGDPFDPTRHEALSHVGVDPEVDVVTCKHIAKAGYRIGDRVVRAAQVLVVDPEPID
jgi:molecular chaperone GrpE